MPDAELKIKVSGDTASGVAAIGNLTKAVNDNRDTLSEWDREQAAAANAATAYGNSFKKIIDNTKKASVVTKEFSDEIQFFGGGLKNTNTAAAQYIKEIQDMQRAAKAAIPPIGDLQKKVDFFGGGVKVASVSNAAFLKSLQPVPGQLKEASGGFDKVAGSVGNAYSGIRKLAFILPGVGIAGLIGGLSEGVVAAFDLIVGASQKAAASIHDDYNVAIEGAATDTAKATAQVESLRINIGLAKEGFISKKGVVEQYNETIGKTAGQLKTLDEVEQALTRNADAYIRFTFLKAAANIALEKASQKAVEQGVNNLKAAEDFLNAGDKLSKFGASNISAPGFVPSFNANEAKATAIAAAKQTGDARRAAQNAEIKKDEDNFKKLAGDFQKQAAEISKDFNFNFFGNNKVAKDKKPLTETQEIEKEIAALEKLKKTLGEGFTSSDEFKLTNLKIQLTDLDPILTSDEKLRFNEKLKSNFFSDGVKITVPARVSIVGTTRDDIEQQINKGFDIQKAVKSTGGFDRTGDQQLSKQSQEIIANITAMEERAKGLSNVLTSNLGPAFVQLFSDIASGGKNALQAFGQAITQIITRLIAAAITAAILSAIISAATGGFGSTAAGGGFASNFKSMFSSLSGLGGMPKLAAGGVASGPTSGYPVILHGTEAVIPLNQMNSVVASMSGDDKGYIAEARISGNDIMISLKRTQKLQNFVS